MRYLITGHTGFKGTWLSLLLKSRGHQLFGVSLDPLENSLFSNIKAEKIFEYEERFDIENLNRLTSFIHEVKPDFVIHLAAQSLVKEGYRNPYRTYSTNVLGTANLLHAIKDISIKGTLIITTDKVYRQRKELVAFTESDELGGEDPYSASKTIADLLTQNWISNFPQLKIGIARAGNVIGGGDVAKDRLVPYLMKEIFAEKPPVLRFPKSIRPWQHVLDCVNGYIMFLDKISGNFEKRILNFGPFESDYKSVEDLTEFLLTLSKSRMNWEIDDVKHQTESSFLALDSTKAFKELGWKNKWNFEESVTKTYEWYVKLKNGKSPMEVCLDDIYAFEKL